MGLKLKIFLIFFVLNSVILPAIVASIVFYANELFTCIDNVACSNPNVQGRVSQREIFHIGLAGVTFSFFLSYPLFFQGCASLFMTYKKKTFRKLKLFYNYNLIALGSLALPIFALLVACFLTNIPNEHFLIFFILAIFTLIAAPITAGIQMAYIKLTEKAFSSIPRITRTSVSSLSA